MNENECVAVATDPAIAAVLDVGVNHKNNNNIKLVAATIHCCCYCCHYHFLLIFFSSIHFAHWNRWGTTHSLFLTFNFLTLENLLEIAGILSNILLALFQSTMSWRESKKRETLNIMNRTEFSFFFVLISFCFSFRSIVVKLIANDSFAAQFI